MNYTFSAYGLQILSDLPIPGLVVRPIARTTLEIHLNAQPPWLASALASPEEQRHLTPGDAQIGEPSFTLASLAGGEFFRLHYTDGATFVVDAATTRLWGSWVAPLTIEDLATYLLGPVLGFVLRQRGVTCLHAGTVEVGGRAAALVGPAEAGKSTTAAALALRGCGVLCEDVSPLLESPDGAFFVQPGYPRVCLWPDAAEKLLGAGTTLPRLTPNWEKCFLSLDGARARFVERPLPLSAVYLLARRTAAPEAPFVAALRPREALLELVQNTYMNYLLDRARRAAEFEFLGRLVAAVPVRRAVPHADPERLPALCEAMEADLASLAMGQAAASAPAL